MEENSPQTSQSQQSPEEKTPEISSHKIPVIRTYEHDIEEAIAQKKISSASISIAEADARRKQPPAEASPAPHVATYIPPVFSVTPSVPPAPPTLPTPPSVKPNPPKPSPAPIVVPRHTASPPVKIKHSGVSGFFKLVISLILICGGIYGGYYLYTISPIGKELLAPAPPPPVVQTPIIPSIITPDAQKIIDVTGMNAQGILSAIMHASGSAGMTGLVLEQTNAGLTTQVGAAQFISDIDMNPPDAFTTSLGTGWMLGTDSGAPFIIFTTNFFQNTFAGMLAWEPTLPEDLSFLFGFNINTTGKYEDRILDNKNIREFVGGNGVPVFLYGFIDNGTLVIARNERTFSDIVGQIEKQTYVR